jgi:ketosteroid isomerase-like protein
MTPRTARMLGPLLASACLGALTACAGHDDALPGDVTNALASAFTRGDVDACADLYRDDAAIMSENAPPVRGKAAIEGFFRDQVARDILFSTDSDVSLVQGDLAMDQGTYRIRDTRRGVDVEFGEYLNVWRLTDGRWRVYRSMYNTTSAPRAGVTVSPDDEPPPR